MEERQNPLDLMRDVYTRSADTYIASAGSVDRTGWADGYNALADALPSGSLVLDLGCGPGYDAPGLTERGFRLVGIDVTRAFLRAANSIALAGRVVQADLRKLPIRQSALDGVWADGVLHHLRKADLGDVLASIRHVLRPEGVLHLSVERGDGELFMPPEGGVDEPRFYALYQPEELEARLESSGFEPRTVFVGGESARSHGFVAITAVAQ